MTQRRNIRPQIFDVLRQIGPATSQRVYECVRVHGLTLRQVQACMWNCASEGLLISSGREANRSGKGGMSEAMYRIARELPVYRDTRAARAERSRPRSEPVPRFASVFHYAQGIAATTEAA
jgi:hypothetical protein